MGVSFDPEIVDALDQLSGAFKELGVTRSEVVNAILADFLEADSSNEAVWEAVSRRRVKKRTA
jgi:metal-responsive CopG/Arc/MetJ family transcriptional regulator